MKIFTKLYLGMMTLLVAALLTSAFFMVKTTLDRNLQRETANGLDNHKIMVTAFRNNLLLFSGNSLSVSQNMDKIGRITQGSGSVPILIAMDDKVLYNDAGLEYRPDLAITNMINYRTVCIAGKTYIAYYSTFVRNGSKFTLVTYSDITHVLDDNNVLRKRYFIMYLIVLSCGTGFALVFSLHLTRPVDRLTEAGERFAGGDYSARITKIPNDELGRLSEVYNSMADTIQQKIEDLNLSVKQKEDFIRAFAHETKTPMTGIIGYADLIYQDRLEGNERKEAAGVILGEGMRLQALSLKLLDIMTLGNENILMEEMNTTEMAHDLENTVRIKAEEKGVEVQCLVEDDYIYVDYDLFKTVLINLADNSIKAGAKVINIRGFRKEYDYIFEVKDDGIGIPASELHRVKEAFYMVDKSRSRKEHGAGLGLSLAERIMMLHKGSLEIESVEGEGTVVRLTLPDKNKNVTSGTD